ncbi:defect-in-organelle-trafficking protein DotC [Natronocella acetinitrilica]|uniref:Defect-in-organelle-trafficking protein DotC n=1 Tax=Natronocella acetinitrilica TaxID=414046 RepID=A0AAE3KFP1_9GAMM|nr:type IV secretory system conjugative DNA transfer family protein [Natronocella acetinitrilica]MCP1674272.1 defect-in-organelle-trafficking protein DotC [Natronocella acetinitrilica]
MKKTIAALLLAGLFSGAAMAGSEARSISDLRSLNFNASVFGSAGGEEEFDLRRRALRDAALATGAQHGYVDQMERLKRQLRANADYMDQTWDFSTVMRLATHGEEELYLLPPVIRELRNSMIATEGHQRLRVSDTTYLIEKRERLVLAPPNWRDYLLFDQPVRVTTPPKPLLPNTPEEMTAWVEGVERGWVAGARQASQEMGRRLEQLGGDYTGMLRYMRLLTEGKIESPFVASSQEWVTGGGAEMRINERVYQISRPSSLNANMDDWKTLELDTRGGYRYPVELDRLRALPGYAED